MTDQELISNLKSLAIELGRSPTAVDCNNCSYTANVSTYRARFGSWNNAKIIAGLETNGKFAVRTKEELLTSLKDFFIANGRAPTQKECRAGNGLYGPNTYKDTFGSWESALQAAQLPLNNLKSSQVSNEDLLNSLQRFYEETSKAPRHEDCNSGQYNYLKAHMVYVRRFGSFTEALKLAGVPINQPSYVSNIEKEVANFIASIYSGNILLSDRTILESGLELDIVIPGLKIAIEVDGLYWHSEEYKSKDYHLEKTLEAQSKGYRLIHIFENEWMSKQEIVKIRLRHILGVSKDRVYARKCKAREISWKEAKEFLEKYHIQGSAPSSVNIGLFDQTNELVYVQTYSKARFTKDCEWELIRAASKYTVVGAVSKALKYFLKVYNPNSIISYCDIRWNTGESYEKAGFLLSHVSDPNYWYFNNAYSLYSRLAFQKHKLVTKLSNFDPNLTEKENMYNNGYKRIYDCGNLVFKYFKE